MSTIRSESLYFNVRKTMPSNLSIMLLKIKIAHKTIKKIEKCLPIKKKIIPLHSLWSIKHTNSQKEYTKAGPFVYRLGRKIFILERGVRFPYGLQVKLNNY